MSGASARGAVAMAARQRSANLAFGRIYSLLLVGIVLDFWSASYLTFGRIFGKLSLTIGEDGQKGTVPDLLLFLK